MKLASVLLAAAAALSACGGSSNKSVATAPAKPVTKCAHVADQLVSLMSDTAKEATEAADQMRREFAQHCEQDRWSAEAQECFLHVTTRQEAAEKCAGMLTAEQGNALMQPPPGEQPGEGASKAVPPEAPAPTSAAPPPPMVQPSSPPPPAPKRAPKKPGTNTSDPCEGGE